jgi:hypothetical protein
VALEHVPRRARRVEKLVGLGAVVVEAGALGDPLQVGEAVGQLVDVQRSPGPQHSSQLVEAGVGVQHVLQHAATEHGGEARVGIGQSARIAGDVRAHVGVPLERHLGIGCVVAAVIEGGHVEVDAAQEVGDLAQPAAPVQDASLRGLPEQPAPRAIGEPGLILEE